jgi:membrane protease subunit HflC
MKNTWTLAVGILIIVVLGLYMVTFQVRFNEAAVVTTFGRAVGVVDGDAGAGRWLGNLHWKWPRPIQQVYTYDTRVHVLDDRLEEQTTFDAISIVVSSFVTWRVDDAQQFHRALQTVENAEAQLLAKLRDARATIGEYTFDQLTSDDPDQLKIAEIEQRILADLREAVSQQDPPYGIAIEQVGIRRILLPEQVTQSVFDRMRDTRQRLAQQARSEGDAAANSIRSNANSARDRILAFVERRAQEIRAEGAAAAADYYEAFEADPDFAIFLRKLEALRETLQHNATFLLDTSVIPFDLFTSEPAEKQGGPAAVAR